MGESPTLLSRSMAQAAAASQMHRSVVSSETFGLIGDEPIKRADIAVRPEVNGSVALETVAYGEGECLAVEIVVAINS